MVYPWTTAAAAVCAVYNRMYRVYMMSDDIFGSILTRQLFVFRVVSIIRYSIDEALSTTVFNKI